MSGNVTSNLGMWTQRVAMGWLTWELTHSAAWLGDETRSREAGPSMVVGMFAGAIIDRVDQLELLRIAQLWSLIYSAAFHDPDPHRHHRHLDADDPCADARCQ